MAFMVPLVKNHYDIYARNNPADHPGSRPPIATDANSLYLSATSLKGGAPVTKQYRIVLTGGKIAPGKKNSSVLVNGSSKASLTQSPGGKLYYRMPSASISLPVVAPRAGSVPAGGGGRNRNKISEKLKGAIVQQHSQKVNESLSNPESPQSVSPPSRPLPHVRRTMRNPVTNRVYSYSVSIPDYVEEENEEDLEDEEDLDEEIDDSDLMSLEDKENNEDLLLFSTSAPAGTGSILSATPTPPPAKQNGNAKVKIANKKQALQSSHSMPSSPEASPAVSIVATGEPLHQRTHSSTSTSSNGSSQANSREYVELLRKFILHLKMLKIGGKSKKARRAKSLNASAAALNNPPPTEVDEAVEAQRRQQRKRKDTMEDSKHL